MNPVLNPVFPPVGSQARRKSDGILGEVYLIDPPHNLLSVRWATVPGAYGHKDYTPDQFASVWELTGVHLAPPRETRVALALIMAIMLALFAAVIVHNAHNTFPGYEPYPQASASHAGLFNVTALHEKYGINAADACAGGADDYIRSIAPHRYHWVDTGPLNPLFDRYSPKLAAPGVLTMISSKAAISDGFGNFKPIDLYCNYDTQSQEVLSYSYSVEGTGQ